MHHSCSAASRSYVHLQTACHHSVRYIQYMGLVGLRRLLTAFSLCLVMGLLIAAPAGSVSVTGGSEPLYVTGGFIPKELSSRLASPIAVFLSGNVRDEPDSPLREVLLRVDRNVSLSSGALPFCERPMLTSKPQACSGAIVGRGKSEFALGSAGTEVLNLAIVNGASKAEQLKLYIVVVSQGVLSGQIVGEATFKRVFQGRFGLQGLIWLPDQPNGAALRKFSLAFNRIHRKGSIESVFSARCRDGHLDSEITSYTLADGQSFEGEPLNRTCVSSQH
jgi:hypothetical protein